MKSLLTVAALLVPAMLIAPIVARAAEGSSDVTYVSADKVTAAFLKGGTIARGSDFVVQTSRRVKDGTPEIHSLDTEIMYVIDGSATYVTGGTMIGAKEGRNGNSGGTSIEGGETRHIQKGDVVVVPRGTPHWFKEVPGPINYYVVKVHAPDNK